MSFGAHDRGQISGKSRDFCPPSGPAQGEYVPRMTTSAAPDAETARRNRDLRARIRERLQVLGLSEEAASRAAGLDKTYLRKLFDRPDSSPRLDSLEKMAGVLGVTGEWLLHGRGEPPAPAATDKPAAKELRPVDLALPPATAMPLDLPVMGTAAGSHARGAFQFEGGVIDYVRRPPALAGSKSAYALYIEGTSMEPEHRQGDLRFVHPDRPPRIGDSVVVQSRHNDLDGIEATIGHLVGRTATVVKIGKLNPTATVEIPRVFVVAVHKVLTVNDLFGV